MSQFENQVKLNVLSSGSYDVLIGMDWIERHQVILNLFKKLFTCLNDKGEKITITRIPRNIYVRLITTSHMKKDVKKGCSVFAIHIINNE